MNSRTTASPTQKDQIDLLFKFAFWLFAGTVIFSAAGMLLLKIAPGLTMQYFGAIFSKLIKTPTWMFMTLLPILPLLMYSASLGAARMAFFFVWGCGIGGASELIGTMELLVAGGVVWPFGAYEYTTLLGPKIAGHVPYFIPLSWFAMSVISLDLARRLTGSRMTRVLLATTFMVLWDVSLDPAMNSGTFQFWSYGVNGFFYGMPFTNWVGWFGVTLIIILGYEYLGGGLRDSHDSASWVYVLNCIFPLVLSLFSGLYGAVLIGCISTAIPFVALRLRPTAAQDQSLSPVQA